MPISARSVLERELLITHRIVLGEQVVKPKEKQAALERYYEQQRKDAQLGLPMNK
jgi:hypothetical protein